MSTKKDDGGSAFPLKEPLTCDSEGMSLRDYFAAKAMAAIIPEVMGENWQHNAAIAATAAYIVADAMLEVRKK